METIKTKPFDLEAIKNGAKYAIFKGGDYSQQFNKVPLDLFVSITDPNKFTVKFGDYANYDIDSNGLLTNAGQIKHELRIIQEPKLASDLSDLKVGDKVWDFAYDWGEIKHVEKSLNINYPIAVLFPNNVVRTYTIKGFANLSLNCNQTLFLTEIKFEIPEV